MVDWVLHATNTYNFVVFPKTMKNKKPEDTPTGHGDCWYCLVLFGTPLVIHAKKWENSQKIAKNWIPPLNPTATPIIMFLPT